MDQVITAASILFGFLFAGFWWALNREVRFPKQERHFKLGYGLILATMVLIAVFGVLLPLRELAAATPALRLPVAGIAAGLAGVFGYMLTELGHYSVFRRPSYYGRYEWFFFVVTVVAMVVVFILAIL